MLAWLQRLFGVARLEDLLHVLVEDVHVRVDDLEARVEKLEAAVAPGTPVGLPIRHPGAWPRTITGGTVTEVMKVTS